MHVIVNGRLAALVLLLGRAASAQSPIEACLLDLGHLHAWKDRGEVPKCLGPAAQCLYGDGMVIRHEPVLRVLLALLLINSDGLLPEGSVVDAGAHLGQEACFYSALTPSRTVHAVDPVAQNVVLMTRRVNDQGNGRAATAAWANLGARTVQPILAGLGDEDSNMLVDRRIRVGGMVVDGGMARNASGIGPKDPSDAPYATFVPIYRLDTLFSPTGLWKGESLALAHLDVEGLEAAVLRGGKQTFTTPRAGGRPIFTVEISARSYRQRELSVVRGLGEAIANVGYVAYIVNEVCGGPECRNFVCIPKERVELFERSSVATLMRSGGQLLTRCELTHELWSCLENSVQMLRHKKASVPYVSKALPNLKAALLNAVPRKRAEGRSSAQRTARTTARAAGSSTRSTMRTPGNSFLKPVPRSAGSSTGTVARAASRPAGAQSPRATTVRRTGGHTD